MVVVIVIVASIAGVANRFIKMKHEQAGSMDLMKQPRVGSKIWKISSRSWKKLLPMTNET